MRVHSGVVTACAALMSVGVCVLLVGCARSEPAAQPAAATAASASPADAIPPPPLDVANLGSISPEFRETASGALKFIEEDLRRGIATGIQAQYDADLATAREKVGTAREGCARELRGWLRADGLVPAVVLNGACLAEARTAAATVGVQ